MTRIVLAAIAFASLPFCAAHAQAPEEPPARIESPDGKTSVRILHEAMPGTDPGTEFFTLEVLRGEKALLRVPTEGYLLTAHWSPDGNFLAVNNRRGNSGDYVWVFDLAKAATLKTPDDKTGDKWIDAGVKQIAAKTGAAGKKSPYRYWLTANGWDDDGKLLVTLRARYGEAGAYDAKARAAWSGSEWRHEPMSVTTAE